MIQTTYSQPRAPRNREQVRALQRQLVAAGYSVGRTGVDGLMGPRTRRAYDAYQAAHRPAAASSALGLPGAARPAAAPGPAPAGPRPAATPPGGRPAQATPGPRPASITPGGRPGLATPGARPAGAPLQGLGPTKDGLTIPRGEGRATTFWNGHMAYKGRYDMNNRQNGGLGAWGDKNAPTDYFVALPVGSRQWHNQKILITNPQTGQQVVARVQDKGPGRGTGAAIDLSPVTMEALGGHFRGDLKRVKFEFAPADAPVGPVR